MHLLITNANDVTSDLLCEALSGNVLRLNWELWNGYTLDIHESSFRIEDNYGRIVSDSNIKNIIWRKPKNSVPTEDGENWYCFQEFKYGILSILQQIREKNPQKLPIDPQHNSSTDKFKQLRIAGKYLPVPEWHFTGRPSEQNFGEQGWVSKSLTGQPIPQTGEVYSKVLYTNRIDPNELSDGYPWFIQKHIEASHDLTVVYVDGKQFAFRLERSLFDGEDWRRSIGKKEVDEPWEKIPISSNLHNALISIMGELNLRFGRIDLLVSGGDMKDIWFLEVNPNGQWLWLDPQMDNGLFDAVLAFLTSE